MTKLAPGLRKWVKTCVRKHIPAYVAKVSEV